MAIKVQVVNIRIYQGSTYVHKFEVRHEPTAAQKAAGLPGDLFDLSGFGARCDIRGKLADAARLFQGDTQTGELAIDVPTSVITLTVAATSSDTWAVKKAVFDIEIYSGAVVKRVVEGAIDHRLQVTR